MPLAPAPRSSASQPPETLSPPLPPSPVPAAVPLAPGALTLFLTFYDLILSLLASLSRGLAAPSLTHSFTNFTQLLTPYLNRPLTHPFYRFCCILDRVVPRTASGLKPPPLDAVPDPACYAALCAQVQYEQERLGNAPVDYALLAAQGVPTLGPRTSSSATPAPATNPLLALLTQSPLSVHLVHPVHPVHPVYSSHHSHFSHSPHSAIPIPHPTAPP